MPYDSTRVIHAGLAAPEQGAPFLPGPTFAGVYHAGGEVASAPYTYGRYHNPTWAQFEAALGGLEGGQAVVFGAGMAAVTAVLGVTLRPGDTLLLPSDCYYTARMLVEGFFRDRGIAVRQAPTAGTEFLAQVAGATVVWLESPSNPGLDVCDIAAIASAAHASGALVVVDNTTPTVLGQDALALGADLIVASDTKALTGHGDLILGHATAREAIWADRLRAWRTQQGAVPGPMEVWLAHRSLATLGLRLERQCANALAIAEYLRDRPEVRAVRYPGLPGDPAHPLARRQMRLFGPVVSFVLADRAAAEHVLSACRLVSEATSFGGVHSTAERRARWGGDAIPDGFIRLSAGCEDPRDLLADLARALDHLAAGGDR